MIIPVILRDGLSRLIATFLTIIYDQFFTLYALRTPKCPFFECCTSIQCWVIFSISEFMGEHKTSGKAC